MAGLYIHIPFCTQKCIYCDFMSGTNLSLREQFIDALIAEMDCYLDFFDEDKIRTIYFGGGTPSLLSVDELKRIYDAIAKRWDVSEVEEFTMACNPDDLSEEYLMKLNAQCTTNGLELKRKMYNAQLLTPSASLVPLKQGDNCGSSTTAYAQPFSIADTANLLPSKVSPFNAKNIDPSGQLRLSVVTTG